MKWQEVFFALPIWIGPMRSRCDILRSEPEFWRTNRIKAKLKSGELIVRGDQWPIFLYSNNIYDAEDPWNGLLRSSLLIQASSPFPLSTYTESQYLARPISIFLLRQARLIRSPKQRGQVMLEFTEWNALLPHPSPMSQHRFRAFFHETNKY